ncbi:MAG: helix-turn-helix transcriptional regulator [Clostridiales Family XIII bacterium]|jgi:predicted transcriptional regulator|nr:helix-turn-helix transcriptional regulator [Clostridiales Family XIII bacterium]
MNWDDAKKKILQNEDVREELKNNETEYKIIEEIIMARQEKNLTQKDLADLVGTKQSNISRLESGNYNPTLGFLNKIAKAIGKELEVRIV